METFEYDSHSNHVIFGNDTINQLPRELARQNLKQPLILSTSGRVGLAEKVRGLLDGQVAGVFAGAIMHTPLPVTDKAVEYAQAQEADSVVSIGGGSTVGLGKAISIRLNIPHICIPTTYSGSEMTTHLGETANGKKVVRSDPKILPGTVIYDVMLTNTLSPETSATSGVNAMAHAVEALYAQNANPLTSLMAREAITVLAQALPEIVVNPSSVSARSQALYGAWLSGACLGSGVRMGVHHKLCHTFGGSFNMPHSETHTVVLPHALSYNAGKVPNAMKELAGCLPGSNGDPIGGLNALLTKLKVKRGLRDFGMKASDIDSATDIAINNAYWNPREVEKGPLRELIRRCWAGEEARADF
ncbi:hypothetical protein MMC09_006915 [Bachmanniomyces sp. S44760]|nr:hypothetical protein [Bachmanniomyces sp. S44760]